MARPSQSGLESSVIRGFHNAGIKTVINLQQPGEHASCGPALTPSGFTYDPQTLMANSSKWKDNPTQNTQLTCGAPRTRTILGHLVKRKTLGVDKTIIIDQTEPEC